MGGKSGKESHKPADVILFSYQLEEPRIGFRYDSRPIELAMEKGYVASDPTKANITEGGENQNMVGVALNYVGSLNYKGYAQINADRRTKDQWTEQGYKSFFWTAVVVRTGGYTFQWLLDTKITDKTDREKMEKLVLNRTGAEADEALKEIAAKYTSAQGVNNIGTTEIVTEKILPADILGYFEIRDNKGDTSIQPYVRVEALERIDGYVKIPAADIKRYEQFIATGGSLPKLSSFV